MSVENTSKYPLTFSALSAANGIGTAEQLRSVFLDSMQEQQRKHKDEPKQKAESAAADKQNDVLSRSEHLRNEKRELNKSELRTRQTDSNYDKRIERKESIQQEHSAKSERYRSAVFQPPLRSDAETLVRNAVVAVPDTHSFDPFPATVSPTAANAAGSFIPLVQSGAVAAVNVAPLIVSAEAAMVPVQNSAAFVPSAINTVSAFTVFSAAGQLQRLKESEEKGKDKSEKKKEKSGSFLSLLQLLEKQPNKTPEKFAADVSVHRRKETAVQPVDVGDEQTEQKNEPKNEVPFEKLLERLEQPVPFNESVNATVNAAQTAEVFDRVQFIRRIAAACQSAANQSGTVRMKLDLGVLGSITLLTAFRGQKLSVRFEVQKEQTKQLLSESIDVLRASLAERNVTLEDVELTVIDN